MKIAVVSCGTRGDVQPTALALGLNAAGHQALLHAPPENEAWVAGLDCPFRALGAGAQASCWLSTNRVPPLLGLCPATLPGNTGAT